MSPERNARPDAALVVLALAGDQSAFAALMHRHREAVYRLACGHVGDADEALDVTQETFVAAYRNLARYDAARPMRAWLARIAINKSRDWRRRRQVRMLFGLTGLKDDAAATVHVPDDTPGADIAMADAEEVRRLTVLIAALPQKLKEVLLLRTVEGLGQGETAATLGISEKAVETRLYRARNHLAEALGRSGRGVGARRA